MSGLTDIQNVNITEPYSILKKEDVFLHVSRFLSLPDISSLMRTSRVMFKLAQEHFRQELWRLKKLTVEQFTETNQTDYLKLYRSIFDRDVLFMNISQFPIDRASIEDLRVFRSRTQKRLFNIGINKFSIGTKFTAFLTHEKLLYFCKTSEYFLASENPHDTFEFMQRENVVKFSTSPRNFIYQTTAGTIHIVFHDQNLPGTELREACLDWTKEIPVSTFKASYGLVAFTIQASTTDQVALQSAQLSKIVQGQDIKTAATPHNDTKLNIVVYHINELVYEDVNLPAANNTRMKKVSEYPFATTRSFAVGYHQLLLVGEDNRLYSVDLSNFANIGGAQPNIIPAKLVEAAYSKNVTQVYSGFASFFVHVREEIKPIHLWATDELISFFASFEEFADYINIVKYEGITGAELANVTKKFMKDRLGMIKDELQLKLQTEINKYRETKYRPEKIFGFGKNESGQLGLSKCTNVHIATKIDLPQLNDTDYIDVIKVGWKNSILVTSERRIFITENRERRTEKKQQAEKSQAQIDEQEDEEERKESSRGGKKPKKSNRKSSAVEEPQVTQATSNISSTNQKPFKGQTYKHIRTTSVPQPTAINSSSSSAQEDQVKQSRWIEITHLFSELKDKRKYKLIEVSFAKDTVCVLGNCYENKRLAQLQRGNESETAVVSGLDAADEDDSKKRLTPVIPILNRIRWDPAFNQDEYTIIYQDRFLKDLEISFNTYEESDVKSYRITQIKKGNKIVWDREKKFEDIC